ncbi:MAG: hypothetical protein V3T72_13880, partial [Thermoanaerobaculia bacterium]
MRGCRLEDAGAAVAREMEHVVAVALDRLADLPRRADLEDPHLDVLPRPRLVDRVEDVLQLALLVEHHVGGPALVRGADRHQNLQRSRQPRRGGRPQTGGAAHGHHLRMHRQQPVVREAQGLERQTEEPGVGGLETHLHGDPGGSAVDQLGDGAGGGAGQAQRPQRPSERGDLGLASSTLGGRRLAPGAAEEAAQKAPVTADDLGGQAVEGRGGEDLLAQAYFDGDVLAGAAEGHRHPPRLSLGRRSHRRRSGMAVAERLGDGVDLVDAAGPPRPHQRRQRGVGVAPHRDPRRARRGRRPAQ